MLIKDGKVLCVGSPKPFEMLLACEFQKSSTSGIESHLYNNTKQLNTLSPGSFPSALQRAGG